MIFEDEVVSLVSCVGLHTNGRCGYCKSTDGSETFGLVAHSLSVEVYQKLIDRGWRRSGTYIYKYTTRLHAPSFLTNTSREQRKALNRFNRYVLNDNSAPHGSNRKGKTNGFDLKEVVHACEYDTIAPNYTPAHNFSVTLTPSKFTREKYALFENYQRRVHNDVATESGFKRFLCDTPLDIIQENECKKYGSYHQEWRLDGVLIAMAVLDLLPHGISSVYFMYHETCSRWSLGKISACREALMAYEGGYEFYYMGFYIHNCQKMRYKGDLQPAYLLDPASYQWVTFKKYRTKLDVSKYYTFAEDQATPIRGSEDEVSLFDSGMPGVLSENAVQSIDASNFLVLFGRQIMPTRFCSKLREPDTRKQYNEFLAAVGGALAGEIIYVI